MKSVKEIPARIERKSAAVGATRLPSGKVDAERIWKDFEDHLIPRLRLSTIDRSIYSYLLRHSRLEGRHQLRFSIPKIARHVGRARMSVRDAVRRLIDYGVLRLLERNPRGHLVEVRLPAEVCAVGAAVPAALANGPVRKSVRIDRADFFTTERLRRAIHRREKGFCFYCRKRLAPFTHCLDHVIPRAHGGRNSYRNLVSCCSECNSQKNDQTARDFLRWLYREQRITGDDLRTRIKALRDLAAGKLRPALPTAEAKSADVSTCHA